MCDQASLNIPWPSGWASNVKSALLHVISLAHYAITCARGWAANSINARVRLAARKPGDASAVSSHRVSCCKLFFIRGLRDHNM